jgi:hypothetical protein
MPPERSIIIAWLRSGKAIGGDDHVARTIADGIERDEHIGWSAAQADISREMRHWLRELTACKHRRAMPVLLFVAESDFRRGLRCHDCGAVRTDTAPAGHWALPQFVLNTIMEEARACTCDAWYVPPEARKPHHPNCPARKEQEDRG